MAEKSLWERIKELFPLPDVSSSQARVLRLALILGLTGILFLLLGGLGDSPAPGPVDSGFSLQEKQLEDLVREREKDLARELARILSKVKGVGRVEVELTLETGPIRIYEVDRREEVQNLHEQDAGGGVREQETLSWEEQVVVLRDAGGNEKALVIKEIQPQVRGVLVVAEGAENAWVRDALTRAASRVLGVPVHRVIVLPK